MCITKRNLKVYDNISKVFQRLNIESAAINHTGNDGNHLPRIKQESSYQQQRREIIGQQIIDHKRGNPQSQSQQQGISREQKQGQPVQANIIQSSQGQSYIISQSDKQSQTCSVVAVRGEATNNSKEEQEQEMLCYQSQTGIPLSPFIIATAAHGLVNSRGRLSKKIRVLIGGKQYSKQDEYNVVKVALPTIKKCKKDIVFQPYDMALLLLDRPLPVDRCYVVSKEQPKKGCGLTVYGFPYRKQYGKSDLNGVVFKREKQNGVCKEVVSQELIHNGRTESGYSGGAIVQDKSGRKHIAVGMHLGVFTDHYEDRYALLLNRCRTNILLQGVALLRSNITGLPRDLPHQQHLWWSFRQDQKVREFMTVQQATQEEEKMIDKLLDSKAQSGESAYIIREVNGGHKEEEEAHFEGEEYDSDYDSFMDAVNVLQGNCFSSSEGGIGSNNNCEDQV